MHHISYHLLLVAVDKQSLSPVNDLYAKLVFKLQINIAALPVRLGFFHDHHHDNNNDNDESTPTIATATLLKLIQKKLNS
jgi:hypothetical protein